jgi:hypothetical protein
MTSKPDKNLEKAIEDLLERSVGEPPNMIRMWPEQWAILRLKIRSALTAGRTVKLHRKEAGIQFDSF